MNEEPDVLAGTLDLLILRTLSVTPTLHGYGIAQHIRKVSGDSLRVEEGSLYPALQRMKTKGWIAAEWKTSSTGRKARYYRIAAAGRKQLGEETSAYQRSIAAINRVLRGAKS